MLKSKRKRFPVRLNIYADGRLKKVVFFKSWHKAGKYQEVCVMNNITIAGPFDKYFDKRGCDC